MSENKTETKVVVVDGDYEIKVDPNALDDVETIELLGEADINPNGLINLIGKIIGMEQFADLKAHYKEKYGRMSVSKHLREVMEEVFKAFPKA